MTPYVETLSEVLQCDGWEIMNERERFQMIHATAAQRAEAFLRTIGKWEEEKNEPKPT
jgi:DNA-binding XRE family transcriptional regulator